MDALYTSLKSSSISFLSVTRTLAAIFLDICTRHLWILAAGKVCSITSSIPARPSVQNNDTLSKPLDLKSSRSSFQISADSLGAIEYPKISFVPSTVIPTAICTASFATVSLRRAMHVASV